MERILKKVFIAREPPELAIGGLGTESWCSNISAATTARDLYYGGGHLRENIPVIKYSKIYCNRTVIKVERFYVDYFQNIISTVKCSILH